MHVAFGMLEGLVMMAVGMITVAVFLGLLVVSMQVTHLVVARTCPDLATPDPSPALIDDDVLRAVAVAAAARLRDAGPRDAGPRDAGPRDVGPRDAGPRDAGPRSAG